MPLKPGEEPCPVCTIRAGAFPMKEGELFVRFELEAIEDPQEGVRFTTALWRIIEPLILTNHVCIHVSKFTFRGTDEERRELGASFRASFEREQIELLDQYADLFLDEKNFHDVDGDPADHDELHAVLHGDDPKRVLS